MENLSGKTILVTGASRGIGRGIAIELAKRGATIAINYSKDDLGAEKTLDIIKSLDGYGKLYKYDISNKDNCKKLIDNVINDLGKIDILINNAGISKIGLFMDTSIEEIEELININMLATMYLSKYVLSHMTSRGKGNIINISSIWGECGASCEVTYSTTKGAINVFTKALAKEVAPFGIRVNAVAPGVIDTEMNSFLDEEEKESLLEEIPASRFGNTEEIGKLVAFLCQDGCDYLTGQVIKVDGALL